MPLRCRICKAWKIGDRILARTGRTDTCRLCEPVNGPARRRAQVEAQLEAQVAADKAWVRQWLLGAPRFEESLLAAARAAGPLGEHPMVPWVDTLDLDAAVDWLYRTADGGVARWPPATDDAGRRLANTLNTNPRESFTSFQRTPFDIGSVFGQRGFAYPPDSTRHPVDDGGDPHREPNGIDVRAGVRGRSEARQARGKSPGEPLGVTWLPDHHTDVLIFELDVAQFRGANIDPLFARQDAVGSIYRDDTDRVIVVWR